MGYRSDVAYTIRFNNDDERVATQSFYTFLAEVKSKPECALALQEVEVDESKRAFYFSVTEFKWYDGYPEVQSHKALMKLAEDWCNDIGIAGGCAYMFMRVGDDYEDVERHCGGNYGIDWVNLSRQLVTDWS